MLIVFLVTSGDNSNSLPTQGQGVKGTKKTTNIILKKTQFCVYLSVL